MTARFADTFFWLALLDRTDGHHAAATKHLDASRDFFVTTRWVLAEVADAMCRPPLRAKAMAMIPRLASDPSTIIVRGSDDLFDEGFKLYADRSDKNWSLTDCISFVVMQRQNLREALTADRHFEQAGFVAMFAE